MLSKLNSPIMNLPDKRVQCQERGSQVHLARAGRGYEVLIKNEEFSNACT